MLTEVEIIMTRFRKFQLMTPLAVSRQATCVMLRHVCLSTFWSYPATLLETEIKSERIHNLIELISRQLNIQALAWIPLSQLYAENQEQRA